MKPGFEFEQPVTGPGGGHRVLDFCLSRRPTPRLFDAHELEYTSSLGDGLVRSTITPESAGQVARPDSGRVLRAERVVLGHVRLLARGGDVLTAYTMGGTLALSADQDCLYGRLDSDAPIVPLNLVQADLAPELIFEWESLLARKSARWSVPAEMVRQRLAAVPASTLYVVAVQAVHDHLVRLAAAGHLPADCHEQQLLAYVESVRRTLEIDVATGAPSLDDLLAPAALG